MFLEIIKLALSYRGSKRLSYTYGPASVTLDPKSVMKINCHVPITSATKLKNYKARNELIQTYF